MSKIEQVDFVIEVRTYRVNFNPAPIVIELGGIPTAHRDGKTADHKIFPATQGLRAPLSARTFDQVCNAGTKLFGLVEWHIVGKTAVDVQSAVDYQRRKYSRQAHRSNHGFDEVPLFAPVHRGTRFEVGGYDRQGNGKFLESGSRQRPPQQRAKGRETEQSRAVTPIAQASPVDAYGPPQSKAGPKSCQFGRAHAARDKRPVQRTDGTAKNKVRSHADLIQGSIESHLHCASAAATAQHDPGGRKPALG